MQSNENGKLSIEKSEAEKILRSVPFEQGFHFYTGLGKFTGETAISLFTFYEELRTIELASVRFHFYRRDFQKWIETTLGDQELASRIDKTPSGLTDEELKTELLKTIQVRFTELQTISKSSNKQIIPQSVNASTGELKKFTVEELKQFKGQAGKPIYFAFEGNVHDVSSSSFWVGGLHSTGFRVEHEAGKDLTKAINSAPHGKEVFSRVKKVGVLV